MRFSQIIDPMIHEGKRYIKPSGTIFYYDKDRKGFFAFNDSIGSVEIELNYYINDNCSNFKEYDDYTLSFPQALKLMEAGKKCNYKNNKLSYYYIANNELFCYISDNFLSTSNVKINDLMKHKWKVVE